MKKCINCGCENAEYNVFCDQCGSKLETIRSCPSCGGKIISDTAKFCCFCGGSLSGSNTGSMIGDKNVISGDVSSTINNTTTYINNDDSKATISCYVCGKILTKGSGNVYKCRSCGQFVCINHIDLVKNKCKKCIENDEINLIEHSMAAFEYKKLVTGKYVITGLKDSRIMSVIIPEQVEAIATHAFEGSRIAQVILPEGLIAIEKSAFKNCKLLRQINLPASLLFIEDEAFYGCEKLDITIPQNIEMGCNAIYGTITYLQHEARLRLAEEESKYKTEKLKCIETIRKYREEISMPNIITVSDYSIVGVQSNGRVYYVEGEKYALDDVTKWDNIIAVSYATWGCDIVGLKSDGTVVAEGYNSLSGGEICDVSKWTNIISVDVGWNYAVGLKSNGTVVAVGDNKLGQCDVSRWDNVIGIAAGMVHTVGLKSDGTVVAVGENKFGQCDVAHWDNIIEIASGTNHTVGLKSDGTVVAVGENKFGQCDVAHWDNIIEIASGTKVTVGLKSDRTVVATGLYSLNVNEWSDIIAVYAGNECIVGLKYDGTIIVSGDLSVSYSYTPSVMHNYEIPLKLFSDLETFRKGINQKKLFKNNF